LSLQPDGFAYALVEGGAKKYTVRAAGGGSLADASGSPTRALARAVAQALKEAGTRRADQVVMSVPAIDTVLRERSLPFSDREKIRQVLKFEVESELYHLDIEDVVCDFVEIHDQRATASILVAAVPKKDLAAALEVAGGAGLDPPVLELDLGALLCTVDALRQEEAAAGEGPGGESLEAWLHLGPCNSLLLVTGFEGLRAARAVPLGWRELCRGLATRVVPELAEPEDAEFEPPGAATGDEAAEGAGGEEEAAEEEVGNLFGVDPELPLDLSLEAVLEAASGEARQAFLRRLVSEVRRGLAAVSTQPVARLRLLGAEVPGLDQALVGSLGVPTTRVELGGGGGPAPDALALGAALRGLGREASAMNLRQEEFRYARGLERVEGPLTFALFGVLAWLLVTAVVDLKKLEPVRRDLDNVHEWAQAKLKQYNEELSDSQKKAWTIRTDTSTLEPEVRVGVLLSRVKKRQKELDELVGEAGVEMPQSCLEAWRLVMKVLAREMTDYPDRWMVESFDFTSLDSRRNRVARVEAKISLTLFGPPATSTARYQRLISAFAGETWTLDAASPGGFAEVEETPGARNGTIVIQVNVDEARRLGA